MKKIIICMLCWILILTQLCGCGGQQEDMADSNSSAEEVVFSDLDALAVADLEGKDNSLDVYSAIVHTHMKVEDPEGAKAVAKIEYALGESVAYRGANHYFEESENNWSELVCASVDGTSETVKKSYEDQIMDLSQVVGTNHYLVCDMETVKNESGQAYGYNLLFQEYNEEHVLVREIPGPFIEFPEPDMYILSHSQMIMDTQNRVHYLFMHDNLFSYHVVSAEGEPLAEYTPDGYIITNLVPLYDERIVCMETKAYTGAHEETDYRIEYVDIESGEATVLLEWTEGYEGSYEWMTLMDENTRLYADKIGLYKSDLKGENEQPLYQWINHGITMSDILALQVLPNQRIGMLYMSNREIYYLCLEPTKEQVELREIVLAVSPGMEGIYKKAVVEFNKKYPTCHVELKSDYDETALLTELIAGGGPVLVDTTLTGFETQKELWEPLDKIFEELGIMNELQPSAAELGKIDGTLYGVITNFWVETVVTGNKEQKEWDYDTFLECIQGQPELKAIMNTMLQETDALRLINEFFIHGLDDNYLLDAKKGKTNFDSAEFRSLVQAAKKYCVRRDFVPPVELLSSGEVLCNTVMIQKPQQIALYRMCYGEDVNYVGYPEKDGSGHYLNSGLPLAVRNTASREEKELACAFLGMLLSYECQMKFSDEINFYLSVRSDVLDKQIHGIEEGVEAFAFGFDSVILEEENIDNERDAETLYALISNAKPYKTFPRELNAIISEELQEYFTDVITEDMLIEHLENRVTLYLDEKD